MTGNGVRALLGCAVASAPAGPPGRGRWQTAGRAPQGPPPHPCVPATRSVSLCLIPTTRKASRKDHLMVSSLWVEGK